MASNNIKGLTVEIGGDTTKLGKALENVNKKSRDLSSELGQINKLLKMDPGNADLLAQKQKVLAEAIKNTAEKLETLKKAEKQVQEQFKRGEVSEDQVRALQREIIQTEKTMESYERAARETAEQIDHLGDESKEAEKHVDKLGDEAQETGKELDKAGDKASQFGDKAKRAGALAATGLAAVGTACLAAIAGLAKATASAAAYADEILTTSTVTGISTEKLQEYGYAAELVDVSVETISKSMAKNIKSMEAARNGTKLSADAYKRLGVSITDANGNLRDGETVYWEIIDKLGQMENETERDALAMQILGKSAQELNPLIEAGADRMKELGQEAHEVGAVLSQESLDAFGAFDDSLQRLEGSTGAAKNALGGLLLPELQTLTDDGVELLNEFTVKLNETDGGLEGFVGTVDKMGGKIAEKAGSLVGSVIEKASALAPSIVTVGISLVVALALAIVGELPGLVQMVSGTLVECSPTLIDGALALLMAVVDAVDLVLPPLIEAVPDLVLAIVGKLTEQATLSTLIQGALTLLLAIVDAIPLLIDRLAPLIPQIVTAIVAALIQATPQILQAGAKLLGGIEQAIPKAVVSLTKALPKIWTAMFDYFKTLPQKVKNVGGDLVAGLWKGLDDKSSWLKNQIKDWVGNVTSFLKKLFGINSPSKVTSWMGEMLDEGFAKGIEDNTQAPVDAMSQLSEDMLGGAEDLNGLAIERNLRHTFSAPAVATPTESGMLDKLDKILAAIERGQIITINGDALVGATADRMNSALGQRRVLAERGAV